MISVKDLFSRGVRFADKNAPAILTGMGCIGLITTTVLAVKATPRAYEVYKELDNDRFAEDGKMDKVELLKRCWKMYTPAAISAALSIGCIISANSLNTKRQAAMAALYTATQNKLADYTDKVFEVVGEKKATEIKEAVHKKQLERRPLAENEVVIVEDKTLCFDTLSGRYFMSTKDEIDRVVNEINKQLISDMFISLNEFYYQLGLDGNGIGDNVGWSVTKDLVEPRYSTQIAVNGQPCLVIDLNATVRYMNSDY